MNFFILTALNLIVFVTCGFAQVAPTTKQTFQDLKLSGFASLVEAAGIQDLFQGTGPFTAFAPSDAAIQKLGERKLNNLKKPENHDALVDLIFSHVIPGKYMSDTFKSMDVTTLKGNKLHISLENGQIRVGNAKVLRKDIVRPNGVIHEIDTVLEP